jgi:hypothetical protein
VYVLTKEFETALSLETRQAKDPNIMRQINLRWKEYFKTNLLKQRSEYYSLLVAKRNGVDINKSSNTDMVSVEIVKAVESKLRTCISEKNVILQERNKIANYARLLIERVRELEDHLEHMTEESDSEPDEIIPTKQFTPKPFIPNKQFIHNTVFKPRQQEPRQQEPRQHIELKPTRPESKPKQPDLKLDDLPAVRAMNIQYENTHDINVPNPILNKMINVAGLEEINSNSDSEGSESEPPHSEEEPDSDALDDDDELSADE